MKSFIKFWAFDKDQAVQANTFILVAIILSSIAFYCTYRVVIKDSEITEFRTPKKVTFNVIRNDHDDRFNIYTLLLENNNMPYKVDVSENTYDLAKSGKKKITLWMSNSDLASYAESTSNIQYPIRHIGLIIAIEVIFPIISLVLFYIPLVDEDYSCNYDSIQGSFFRMLQIVFPIMIFINLLIFLVYS